MLTELFKTKERVRIISYILYQKNFTVSQVSNETGVTKKIGSSYRQNVYICASGNDILSVGLLGKL